MLRRSLDEAGEAGDDDDEDDEDGAGAEARAGGAIALAARTAAALAWSHARRQTAPLTSSCTTVATGLWSLTDMGSHESYACMVSLRVRGVRCEV